jgi:hypothetical protein
MLNRKRRDWFSIVATDLFCGALAAVIILDAVSPKEVLASQVPILITVRYEKQRADQCGQIAAVTMGFELANRRFTSLDDLAAIPSDTGNACVLRYLFHTTQRLTQVTNPQIIVANMNGTPKWAELRILGAQVFRFQCAATDASCVLR